MDQHQPRPAPIFPHTPKRVGQTFARATPFLSLLAAGSDTQVSFEKESADGSCSWHKENRIRTMTSDMLVAMMLAVVSVRLGNHVYTIRTRRITTAEMVTAQQLHQ